MHELLFVKSSGVVILLSSRPPLFKDWITLRAIDISVSFNSAYPMYSNLSTGQFFPTFDPLRPVNTQTLRPSKVINFKIAGVLK